MDILVIPQALVLCLYIRTCPKALRCVHIYQAKHLCPWYNYYIYYERLIKVTQMQKTCYCPSCHYTHIVVHWFVGPHYHVSWSPHWFYSVLSCVSDLVYFARNAVKFNCHKIIHISHTTGGRVSYYIMFTIHNGSWLDLVT